MAQGDKPSATAIRALAKLVGSLEAWQERNKQHDPMGLAGKAKNELMRLLDALEAGRE